MTQLHMSDESQYELHHDVMASAILDWSNRQRLRKRQNAANWRIIGSAAAVIAVLAAVAGFTSMQSQQEAMAKQQRELEQRRADLEQRRKADRLVGTSYSCMQAANSDKFDSNVAVLSAVDAVAEYRKSHQLVSPGAVYALALATQYNKIDAKTPAAVDRTKFAAGFPCIVSPDGQTELMAKNPQTLSVRLSDDQIKPATIKDYIQAFGFSLDSKRFAIKPRNGNVVFWTLPDLTETSTDTPSLATALNLDESQLAQRSVNAPSQGWGDGDPYESAIQAVLLDALCTISGRYTQGDRSNFGIPDNLVTDAINDAFASLASGNLSQAQAQLKAVFHRIDLPEKKVNEVLAAVSFTRATKLDFNSAPQNAGFSTAAQLDSNLAKSISDYRAQKQLEAVIKQLIDKGNAYAQQGNTEQAKIAYNEAIKKSPDLKRTLDPDKEVEKREWILPNALEQLRWAYRATTEQQDRKNDAEIAALFRKVIDLDHRQTWIQAEIDKYESLPTPTPNLQSAPSNDQPITVGEPSAAPAANPTLPNAPSIEERSPPRPAPNISPKPN